MLQVVMLLAEADKQAPEQAPPWSPLLMMGAIFALFFFMVILPARRRERLQRETLATSLKKNDKVLTSAGIIGIVADLKDDEAILKIDESANVRMRILRSTIVRILTPKEPGTEAPTDAPK